MTSFLVVGSVSFKIAPDQGIAEKRGSGKLNRAKFMGVIVSVAVLGSLGTGQAVAASKGDATGSDISTRSFKALKHVEKLGEVCGTEVIDKETGHGKTTLVMNVKKGLASKVSAQMEISKGAISAGVGYDVSKSIEISKETRYEVPKGKFGTVEAYVQYKVYRGMIYESAAGPNPDYPTGKTATVRKPVGICFNEWSE